jgi:hypothetical protein
MVGRKFVTFLGRRNCGPGNLSKGVIGPFEGHGVDEKAIPKRSSIHVLTRQNVA